MNTLSINKLSANKSPENKVISFEQTYNKYNNTINAHISEVSIDSSLNTKSREQTLAEHVSSLCITHQASKKWILLIDDEEATVSALSNEHSIDKSKILHINNRKVTVNANNIETALLKGNCSAIVLANNTFQQEQISHLSSYAAKTNTTFLVLDKVSGLH
jgi:hypothetical protein